MKQLFISLFVLLANVGWAQASTVETTLWEETYTGEIVLNSETVATFKAGDVLRVYVTVPSNGANFKICYKGTPNGWSETAIPSIDKQWPWVNGDETYYEIPLTDGDITALAGNNIYINKGDDSTIDRVSLITTVPDEEPEEIVTLWTGSLATENFSAHVDLSYDNKGSLSQTFMTDVLRITYTTTGDGAQIQLSNPDGWERFSEEAFAEVEYSDEAQTFEYTVANASVLEDIQHNGVLVRGKNINVTKVELVKMEGRYDAVPLTIGSDGIATFGSSKHLDFTGTGVTPYYATAVETGKVTLTSTDKTRAWTGCVVKGNAGYYEIPVTSEVEWQDYMHNLVSSGEGGTWVYRSAYSDYSGDNETKIKTYYRYIFAKDKSNNIAFYKLATDYSRSKDESTVYYYELGAHKAYLEYSTDVTPPTADARVALLFSDGETTAVQTIEAIERPQSDKIYNISGQQVVKPTRGFYIINGKKVIIK